MEIEGLQGKWFNLNVFIYVIDVMVIENYIFDRERERE